MKLSRTIHLFSIGFAMSTFFLSFKLDGELSGKDHSFDFGQRKISSTSEKVSAKKSMKKDKRINGKTDDKQVNIDKQKLKELLDMSEQELNELVSSMSKMLKNTDGIEQKETRSPAKE